MESQQTSRSTEDPVLLRGSSMVKENPVSAVPGVQVRPQGHPPLSPRYPINNGSVGGSPRLGGQQAPILHRLDSRSSLGSPTSGSGGQFVQPRAPRPQNPQGNQIQGTRPPSQSNPQGVQGTPRYPGIPGSPGVRPFPNNFAGSRPPIYNANQPQQIYYQPRLGEIRTQRPMNPESGATSQFRLASSAHNPETRHPAPQIIPAKLMTSPAKDDASLRDGRVNDQSGGLPSKDLINERRSQPVARQEHPRDKMEVIDSRSPTPDVQISEPSSGNAPEENDKISKPSKGNAPEENEKILKPKASPRAGKENDEDDDDDVVMDREKKVETKIEVPKKISNVTLGAESARVESPSPSVSPVSTNSYRKSASPSPVPPVEPPGRSTSANKVESSDEPPGEKLSNVVSPVPSAEDKSRESSRSESRLGDSPKHVGPLVMGEDSEHSVESMLKVGTSDPEGNADLSSELRSESRSSSVQSSRSPIPPRTPDHPVTLSVPDSASPQLQDSPISPQSQKSQKSPQGSIKGFDNGRLRSLSPKSPTPSISPASPNLPNSPVIPISADEEMKQTTLAENSEHQVGSETNNEETGNEVTERSITPGSEVKGKPPTPSKASERAQTAPGSPDGRKSSVKRSTSGRSIKSDAGSDSGANQTNQGAPTTNGVSVSPTKKLPSKSREGEKRTTASSPVKSPSKSVKSLPRTPEAGPPSTVDKKKVPMNKVQVGAAPSPNLKTVRSKIGSLDNASYKPGGGKVKIENRKLDFSKAQPKIAAKNDKYIPSGGDKKITQVKLQWNAKPKVGSLDNATYKPGGGDKKIETVKLDFKDKAKPKVGSKDNAKHVPGGGTVKSSATPPKTPQDPPILTDIETQKIDIKAESKIGSLDNVKHKPGGGDKKIFNDRDYLRQTGSNVESLNGSGAQIKSPSVAERPTFIEMKSNPPEPNPPPTTPTRTRPSSAASPITPRTLKTSFQAKSPESPTVKGVSIADETSSTRKSSITEGNETPKRPMTPKSPGSSRPPSSLDAKSVTDKSPKSSRKSSPNGLHLPKLMSTQSSDNSNELTPIQNSPKIKLPKLLETATLSSRVELTQ